MQLPDKEKFNADLKAKLVAAGFTEQEQLAGMVTAEFKAALMLLKTLGPSGALPFFALSTAFSKAMAHWTDAVNLESARVVSVSEIVGEACMAHAETTLAAMLGMARIPLGNGAAAQSPDCGEADCPVHGIHGAPAVGGLDATPATDSKEVN